MRKKIENNDNGGEEPKSPTAKKFVVEGTNWKVGVTLDSNEFDNLDDTLIECATRGVEFAYYADPSMFKLGAYVQVTFDKKPPQLRWVNSHTILVNASLHKLAKVLKIKIMELQKIDIEKEKTVV